MRTRSALALAALLALPMALAALPDPGRGLQAHRASVQLGAQLQALLDRAASLEGESGSPGAGVVVHWLAGDRVFTHTMAGDAARAVDLDGDGRAELRARVEAGGWPRLVVEGLGGAAPPWTAWIEAGEGRWGLVGAGPTPGAVGARLLAGTLEVRAAMAGSEAWHAAFAITGHTQRSVAWLAEARGPRAFEVHVGEGAVLRSLAAAEGGVRAVVLDGERAVDWTLRGAPRGAAVLLDPSGGLRYRAPAPGGALAYAGDAGPLGQAGQLVAAVAPLPASFDLHPAGEGAALAASEPTDVLLDWAPRSGDGVRMVGNGVREVAVQPGAAGGVVVQGSEGAVVIERPAGRPAPVALGSEVAAAGQRSPWPSAVVTGMLAATVGMAAWRLHQERRPGRAA